MALIRHCDTLLKDSEQNQASGSAYLTVITACSDSLTPTLHIKISLHILNPLISSVVSIVAMWASFKQSVFFSKLADCSVVSLFK